MIVKGSCLCRAVCYEVHGPMREIIACHCVECRKQSGHYTAATAVRPQNLHIVEDRGLRWYRASDMAQRGFCKLCGGTLFWKPDAGDRISIYAGSIDGEISSRLVAHIFTKEKGSYYEINEPDECHLLAAGGARLGIP